MSNLKSLKLLPSYHKGENDIAREFYLPCMEESLYYDRAVGFFSSTIYIIAWKSLKQFVNKGGKIKIICSPIINQSDLDAIEQGYSEKERLYTDSLMVEIEELFKNPYTNKPTKVLATLVAKGIVDIKIAFLKGKLDSRHKKIFHDKVGIFTDENKDSVVFKGSMNETYSGLANDGNIESVDVFVTWEGERDSIRVENEKEYFEKLWKNEYSSADVIDFPDVVRRHLIKDAEIENWPELVDEINNDINIGNQLTADVKPGGKTPRPHQTKALLDWMKNDRKGIFEHATGSGKTFTALCAIRDSLNRGETPLILVPSELLLTQWNKEVNETLKDIKPQILLCGGGNNSWKTNKLLYNWTKKTDKPRIVIAILPTASSDMFLKNLNQDDHLFIIADEVHRIGSINNRRIFNINCGPRLGLSATPRRAGDLEGTELILQYFNGIIPPPFTLKDAIESKALTRYMYFVHSVQLSTEEQESWDVLTKKIKKSYAINSQKSNGINPEQSKHWLIERARIIKSAEKKIDKAVEILSSNYKKGQRWIVYCDSQNQLNKVLFRLREMELDVMEYHSTMKGDKDQTLRFFEVNGGIIVSIKCLDEGVDIPSVSHALILASSKNPREFIQRRGRVLRKAEGKLLSFIYDVIVRPNVETMEDPESSVLIESEMARAIEFGEGAENPSSIYELKRILLHLGLNYKEVVEKGFEEDEE